VGNVQTMRRMFYNTELLGFFWNVGLEVDMENMFGGDAQPAFQPMLRHQRLEMGICRFHVDIFAS